MGLYVQRKQEEPTWCNTRKRSATSAYSSTSLRVALRLVFRPQPIIRHGMGRQQCVELFLSTDFNPVLARVGNRSRPRSKNLPESQKTMGGPWFSQAENEGVTPRVFQSSQKEGLKTEVAWSQSRRREEEHDEPRVVPTHSETLFHLVSRKSGDRVRVKRMTSSPVLVLMSWCMVSTLTPVTFSTIASITGRAVSIR